MPAAVERIIRSIQNNVGDKGKAIAIAKSKGLIKQSGKHLTLGRRKKRRSRSLMHKEK